MARSGFWPINSLCGPCSSRQTFRARRQLGLKTSGPLVGLMAYVTTEEGYFPVRHQPACGGRQTATRFFHPRPEGLRPQRRPSQAGTNGSMHRRHPRQQPTPITQQEVPPLLLDWRERLLIQVTFDQIDMQQSVGQRKVGQITDRAPTASAEKTAPPQSGSPRPETSSRSFRRCHGVVDPDCRTADTSSLAVIDERIHH